tara:strand:- start:1305 stop:2474 length:1170 start_codon:yes stop_codon:yes gene_type:complete
MLEQAIVDAEALREAATKNAETMVLEKYSNQIKEAVQSLLEQEDLEAELGADLGLEGEAGGEAPADPAAAPEGAAPAGEPSSVLEHLPMAATSDSDDEIEIPLDKLLEEVTRLSESMRFNGDEVLDEDLYEGNWMDIGEGYDPMEEGDDFTLEEELMLEEELAEEQGYNEGYNASATWSPSGRPEEFLEEHLTVDVGSNLVSTGYTAATELQLQLAEEELLALEQDSKVREEQEAKRKAVQKLTAVNETLSRENNKLTTTLNKSTEYMTKLRNAVLTLEEKLDKVSLDNAKLLYQNKALISDSLNERQKHKLAEAVSNAETIEEAKVIFETLQSTVGSTSRKQQPNSLSEAVQKSSSVILSARQNSSSSQKKSDPTLDRWKFLAGIDKQ